MPNSQQPQWNSQQPPVEDIFAGADDASTQGSSIGGAPMPPVQEDSVSMQPNSMDMPSDSLRPPTPLPPDSTMVQEEIPQQDEYSYQRVGRGSKMRLKLYGVAVLVLAMILAGVWLWRSSGNTTGSSSNINQVTPVNTPTEQNNNTATGVTDSGRRVDSDGDGLLDSEEESLGTNAGSLDTDGDGLNDRQEVQIYKTDPKDKDSDSDGFSDGEEVRNFYNPNGSGKLLDTVNEIDKAEEAE